AGGGAAAGGAGERQGASVELGQRFRDGEAEAPADLGPGLAVLDLAEGLQRALEIGGRDADAAVLDPDADLAVLGPGGPQGHAAAGLGELHRGAKEVQHDLLQVLAIDIEAGQLAVELGPELETALACTLLHHADAGGPELADIDRLRRGRHLAV